MKKIFKIAIKKSSKIRQVRKWRVEPLSKILADIRRNRPKGD